MFRQETRALNDLRIAGWIRSLPLPVQYSSTHVAGLFAYAALAVVFSAEARCSDAQTRNREQRPATRLTTSRDVSSGDSRIGRFVYCSLDPVATTTPAGLPVWGPRSAPGSVFVDSRCRTVCLRGFGGRVFSGSEMQRCTNTEPGVVATGPSVDYEPRCSSRNSRIERFAYRRLQPVAAAPRSVFVDSRCQPSCVDIIATRIMNRERSGDRVHVRSTSEASCDKEYRIQHVLPRRAHTNDQDW